jgi:hypothetical protein
VLAKLGRTALRVTARVLRCRASCAPLTALSRGPHQPQKLLLIRGARAAGGIRRGPAGSPPPARAGCNQFAKLRSISSRRKRRPQLVDVKWFAIGSYGHGPSSVLSETMVGNGSNPEAPSSSSEWPESAANAPIPFLLVGQAQGKMLNPTWDGTVLPACVLPRRAGRPDSFRQIRSRRRHKAPRPPK